MRLSFVEGLGRYDSVYVSAHPLDALLSCSVRLLSERGKGLRVLALTIYEATEDRTAHAEEAAQRRLGLDLVSLGMTASDPGGAQVSVDPADGGDEDEFSIRLGRLAHALDDVSYRTKA